MMMVAMDTKASAYTYKLIGVGGAPAVLQGNNDSGQMVGYFGGGGFLYSGGDTVQAFRHPRGNISTFAHGINEQGIISGSFITDMDSGVIGPIKTHGFTRAGTVFDDVEDRPKSLATYVIGLNGARHLVGYYQDPSGLHGFVFDGHGYSTIGPDPASTETKAWGINDSGHIVGHFSDDSGVHGFTFDGKSYLTLDYPGASATMAFGINALGHVVGAYHRNSRNYAFLYLSGNYSTLDDPPNTETMHMFAYGINNVGQIVGYITTKNSARDAFIADPAGKGDRRDTIRIDTRTIELDR